MALIFVIVGHNGLATTAHKLIKNVTELKKPNRKKTGTSFINKKKITDLHLHSGIKFKDWIWEFTFHCAFNSTANLRHQFTKYGSNIIKFFSAQYIS